jgi:soluble lytic murein transglycosylase
MEHDTLILKRFAEMGLRGFGMRRILITIGVLLVISAAILSWIYNHTSRYDYIIAQAAARNELDFNLVKALIYEESWFRPKIRGPAGELGLMQITKAAASDFTLHKGFPPLHEDRLLEPELNVEVGCWYLKQSIEHYKLSPQPVLFALLRYNAGELRADSWLQSALSVPPPEGALPEDHYLSLVDFPKTRVYVRRILDRSRSRNFFF